MKRLVGSLWMLMLTAATLAAAAPAMAGSQEKGSAAPVRLGIYDSRIVALAYGRSTEFEAHIKDMINRLEKAKAEGDEETVAKLKAEGPALQDQMHHQVFGNAPIPGIIERIEDRLPDIAREAGVDMIVCKWDVAFQNDAAQPVDVTMAMVALFNPTPETLKHAEQLKTQPPVPADAIRTED
jgi:hypothetical protein